MNDTIHQYLAVGSSVDQFEIREILGSGGFGITYKAWDARLERDVALKEFLPTDLAIREGSSRTVKARTDRVDDYRFALDKFLQEARLLARFSHPNIVRVTQFLEANGTAYLVMDYERGDAGHVVVDRLISGNIGVALAVAASHTLAMSVAGGALALGV
ncbi:MAG: protein kinase, partial [Pseudomonadota bacterium]